MNANPAFNYKRNRDKLFANLISIIDGILSDGELSDTEILYVTTWLNESHQISDNPFIQLLKDRITRILDDGIITKEERLDLVQTLKNVQQSIMDMPSVDLYSKESDVNLLIGLCKGIVADKKLEVDEINYLDWWLSKNGQLKKNYPGKYLYELIKKIKKDGVINKDENQLLYQALVDFSGTDLEYGVVDGMSSILPCDQLDVVEVKNSSFCLTGSFISGKRATIAERINSAGGSIVDRVTHNTHFLVIGAMSSRDWRFSSYGRKIEKAILDRDNGRSNVKIITEELLIKSLPASR
ncbi:BRCT domain-containing protein [Proteus mirabilis]|uniref:BRCT domain-containing protein n=1 Tax=Proteus mirabilis TaxID=584 RepID=UPI0025577F69|nr:BRCT domain-containing protein [Proteus mirabilis]MDK7936656.1 BRCT domain-containing protein [Proteus mirabilis]